MGSLADITEVIEFSSHLVGSQEGEVVVPTRDWAEFLSPKFRRVVGIKQYHHFRFDRSSPGVVYLKLHSGTVEQRMITKDRH